AQCLPQRAAACVGRTGRALGDAVCRAEPWQHCLGLCQALGRCQLSGLPCAPGHGWRGSAQAAGVQRTGLGQLGLGLCHGVTSRHSSARGRGLGSAHQTSFAPDARRCHQGPAPLQHLLVICHFGIPRLPCDGRILWI
ncbi:unnamed protein product, partial [Polarella glacialis]